MNHVPSGAVEDRDAEHERIERELSEHRLAIGRLHREEADLRERELAEEINRAHGIIR